MIGLLWHQCSWKVLSYLLKLDRCKMGSKTGSRLVSLCSILDQKVFKDFSRFLFSTINLKSPIKIVLSYWQVNQPNVFARLSRKYFSFWQGGLCNPIQSHFRFFTVKLNRIISISLRMDSSYNFTRYLFINVKDEPSSKNIFIPSNCLITIYFKLLIRIWSLVLVSDIRPISIFPFINYSTAVNLFLKEFIFRWPIIKFLGFFKLWKKEKILMFRFKSKLFCIAA